jgi:PST family polysaccharide transporter
MPIKAMLEKELRIKEIQKAEILIAVGAIIVQIIIAMAYDWGYIGLEQPGIILFTSLVLVQVARTLFFVSKSRFVVNFSWMDIKSIYKKSAEVVTGDLANVFATEGDNMIISRYMELASLGIYSNAYKLMKMPTKLLSNVFNQIAFPAFAILDQERLKLVYVKLIYLISYVLFPLIAVILLFYKEIVLIILGPQWEAVELPFLILAVGIYLRLVYKVPTTVLKARDKFRTLMTGQIIYALLSVLLAFAFKSQGVPGVAFATVLALFLYNVFLVIVMRKEFPLKLSDYIRVLTRPAFMFIGSFAVLYASKLGLEQMMNNNTLVFAISLGFYLLLIGLLFKKKREFLLGEDGMWWYSTLRKKDKK